MDNQPFSIVQDAEFPKLVEFLEPRYVPSHVFLGQALTQIVQFIARSRGEFLVLYPLASLQISGL